MRRCQLLVVTLSIDFRYHIIDYKSPKDSFNGKTLASHCPLPTRANRQVCNTKCNLLNIMMAVDSLILPKVAFLSIYLLLKPLLSKFPTPPSADKKNSCIACTVFCTNDPLSLVFFQPITACLFPIKSRFFSCALQSDNSF